jgi:hypothetical protein
VNLRRRLEITVIVGGVVGCHSAQPANWPDITGAQALLEIVEAPGQSGRVELLVPPNARDRIAEIPLGTRITWLGYDQPAEALGLTGLRYAPAEDPGRRPPPPDDRWEGVAQGSGLNFGRVAEAEAEARVRLASLDFLACVAGGGCAARDDQGTVSCKPSCDPGAPQAPQPVGEGPCRAGWQNLGPIEAGACLPPERRACPLGEAQFYGQTACEVVGRTFSDYPTELPAGRRVYYVRPTVPAGGTGTATAPFSLSQALRQARGEVVLALAPGRYPLAGPTPLPDRVSLIGAGLTQTTIIANSGPIAFNVDTASVSVRNLSIEGPTAFSARSSRLVLNRVRLGGPRQGGEPRPAAIDLVGGQLIGQRLVMAGGDFGVRAVGGAQVELKESVFDGSGSDNTGIIVEGEGTHLRVERCSFFDLVAGVLVRDQASANLDQLSFDGIRDGSVESGTGADTEGAGLFVSRTRPNPTRRAFYAYEGGRLALEGVVVEGAEEKSCVYANGRVEGMIATLELRRALLLDCVDEPVLLDRSTAQLEDLYLENSQGGIFAIRSRVDAERLRLRGQTATGICLSESPATLSSLDLDGSRATVRFRQCGGDYSFQGVGLEITIDSPTTVVRSRVHSWLRGILAYNRDATFTDGQIDNNGIGILWPPEVDPFAPLLGTRFAGNGADLEPVP